MGNFFDEIKIYGPGFLEASWTVFGITILTIAVSWACGLVAALAQRSEWKAVRMAAGFYIWFIRGTPTLIQVFLIYFGLPQIGIRLSPFTAGVIALGINSGAYVAEAVAAAAALFHAPSGDLAERIPAAEHLLPVRVSALSGGLPVRVDGRVVAGLGVGGPAPFRCAELAAAVLADRG